MFHTPVLLQEILSLSNVSPGDTVVDCNLGAGGHTKGFLELTGPHGKVVGIDLDPDALAFAKQNLSGFADRMFYAQSNFSEIESVVSSLGIQSVKAVLFDLGVSSYQLDASERGFTFREEKPLDMRFGANQEMTAYDLLNTAEEEELRRIFWSYGELREAKKLAEVIVEARTGLEIASTFDLRDVALSVFEKRARGNENRYLARVFQAVRMAVNDELAHLERALSGAVSVLDSGGRLMVLSYHSLEDRLVKHFIKDRTQDCVCPPEVPICVCDVEPELSYIVKKPLTASEEEIAMNPRSRSAKLRVVEKI